MLTEIETMKIKAASYLTNLAWLYTKQNQYKLAREELIQSLRLNAKSAKALVLSGFLNQVYGNWHQSSIDLEAALQLQPNMTVALYCRAHLNGITGRLDEAIKDYSAVIEQSEVKANFYYCRGSLYSRQNKFVEALNDFNKIVDTNPDYYLLNKGYGRLFYAQKKYELALENFNKAINLMPTREDLFTRRGKTYDRLGKVQDAMNDFNKAVELSKSSLPPIKASHPHKIRGKFLAKMGNYNDAINDYSISLEQSPNCNVFIKRAYCYYILENYQKALADCGFGLSPSIFILKEINKLIANKIQTDCQQKLFSLNQNISPNDKHRFFASKEEIIPSSTSLKRKAEESLPSNPDRKQKVEQQQTTSDIQNVSKLITNTDESEIRLPNKNNPTTALDTGNLEEDVDYLLATQYMFS